MTTPTGSASSPDSGRPWAEPGVWPVAQGVHRVPLPLPADGLRAVNVYVLETADGLTLVDGGWAIPESRELLEKSLAGIGYDVRDITRFLVTHVHRDHYTQAVTIRREVGSHVSLGLGEKPSLDLILDPDHEDRQAGYLERAGAHELAREWARFARDSTPDVGGWGRPDAWLDGDHRIEIGGRVLDAVHTPGHTQGHFVFVDGEAGILFAGDHVLPTITPSVGFEAVLAANPLGDFLGSLTKVRGLPDLQLLPAHGPVAPSSHTRVDELLAHHDERLRLCRDVVRGIGMTAYDVARELPWTRHARAFGELDLFNASLATLETRAHLELLVARGELVGTDDHGVRGYASFRCA